MKAYEVMKKYWEEAFADFASTPAFARLARGECELKHYKSVMRQIFHHARENPQIQAFATAYFRGEERNFVKMFFKHASQEIGHDYLALNDLAACGEDVSKVPYEKPLPATTALIAFPFYQIQFRNPVSYLGYLFYLEYTPVQTGRKYMDLFRRIGVPENALTFIEEHATVDVAHNKLMEQYVEKLIRTEADLKDVGYAIRTTARLYARMIEEAFLQADRGEEFGWAFDELEKEHSVDSAHRAGSSHSQPFLSEAISH